MFHLGWFLSFAPQAWNEPHSDRAGHFPSTDFFVDFARSLERAGFDYLMIEDGSFLSDAYGSSMEYSLGTTFTGPKHDPMALLPLLAAGTEHIGLIATMTTSFYPPFLAARLMATLDHLSRGRVGFNLVTAHNDRTAQNFGLDKHYGHAERYAIATEWAEVVTKLLHSWDAGAVEDDWANGTFIEHTRIHEVNHEGRYFSSRGPLNIPAGPQGMPVICQAGGSPAGRAFAAQYADTIVSPGGSIEWMKEYRTDVRAQVSSFGRDPDAVKILFLTDFFIGDTDEDALALQRRAHAAAADDYERTLAYLSFSSGIDFKAFDLDKPVPPFETNAAKTTTAQMFAGREHLTLREIAGTVVPGLEIVGSPATAAEQMEAVMAEVGGDGFLVNGAVTPRRVADIAGDLAPELRRRGLIRSEYGEATLRGNLTAY